jgi:hypothetical protein
MDKSFDILSGETAEARFYTQYDRPVRDESEHPSLESQTETGYVPPEVQIEDMMRAGKTLMEYRKARFDTVELADQEGDEIPLDPTREPGVDLVDVMRASRNVFQRLKAQKEKADAEEIRKVQLEKTSQESTEKEG